MKLIEVPKTTIDVIMVQTKPCSGRREYSDFILDTEGESVELYKKIDKIEIPPYTLMGVIPMEDKGNGKYNCCLDWFLIEEGK